jgi:2-keto-4-pentenoate hydratase/2-oxohepta-3-ene-1,7-dioic acid hydratase in catechol pathway
MKLLTYRRAGAVRHGYLVDEQTVGELGDGDLGALLVAVNDLAAWRPPAGQRFALSGVQVLAPLLRPGKLLAAAANYQDHVTEAGGPPLDKTTLAPRLFLKPPTAIVGPDGAIPMPSVSRQVDWEAELAVVIGRVARDIDVDTADEIPDPQALPIALTVNGVTRQRSSTKNMIFSVAELVAFASRLMTLEPGDVLMTGTPAGVGATTGEYLSPGDEMTVLIDGVGSLTNRIVSADHPTVPDQEETL